MTIREVVFATLSGDAALNALGINAVSLWQNHAPDSPPAARFAVLRWGPEVPALLGSDKRVTNFEVTLWPYDIDQDFAGIDQINRRWCSLMDSLAGQPSGDGWIIETTWGGDGQDGWDDGYERVFRTSSYTIIKTG